MSKIPQKVFIALESIDNSMQSICEHNKKGKAYEVFFIIDTLRSFDGSILRAVGKENFSKLSDIVSRTMRAYAYFIDSSVINNVEWETVDFLATSSHELISKIIQSIR